MICQKCRATFKKPMLVNSEATCPKCGETVTAVKTAGTSALIPTFKVGARFSAESMKFLKEIQQAAQLIYAHVDALKLDPPQAAQPQQTAPEGTPEEEAQEMEEGEGDAVEEQAPPKKKPVPPQFKMTYVKSLRLPHAEQFIRDVIAVKYMGENDIRGYSVLWGDPSTTDLEGEYFTKRTDFWDKSLSMPRPLTYEHGMEGATKSYPIVGQAMEFGDDDVGRWYRAQLDRAHKYRKAIDALISKRELGTSSDSAPQYVQRERAGKATWLKTWPLFAWTLTTSPCEPRMLETVQFKSIGIDLDAWGGAQATAQAAQLPNDVMGNAYLIKAFLEGIT